MTEEGNTEESVNNDARLEEGQTPESNDVDVQSENIQEDKVDYESFAKVQGWAAKDKWRGDESKWVDAEAFVKRGQEFQSSLKVSNQTLKQELQEQRDANERTLKMMGKINDKAKADALREIREQQKQALEEDDNSRYDELEGNKTKVYEDFKVEQPKQQQQQEEDPLVATFRAENPWYDTDHLMTGKAQEYSQKMAKKGLSLVEELAAVKRYIVHEFPDEFENPKRQAAPTVSVASAPGKAKKNPTISDMTPADQRMAKRAAAACGMDLNEYVKECFKMENLS